MAQAENRECIYLDSRPLAERGNSIAQYLDVKALRELGVVDEHGNLVADISAQQRIYADGTIEIDLPIEDITGGPD